MRALKRGWRPTGAPARDVRRKLATMKRRAGDQYFFAVRGVAGHRYAVRPKPVGGRVLARNLSRAQLTTWAKQAHAKAVAM